ncbi:MAG TPA: phosphodiester glycosidase family protein [Nocardioidaceae bacterium]|nr:phosphodiester glycosidase family protein [Nocardioidaceae bacterium]
MRRTLGALLVACCLLPALPASAGDDRPPVVVRRQTSDGVPGEVARALLPKPPVITDDRTLVIAPGLTLRQWTQTDERGAFRAHLLTGSLDEPTLQLRYLGAPYVRQRVPVTRLVSGNGAIAGVNGDFFDIYDLGAPFGLGVDRRKLLHGHLRPNAAFILDATGEPQLTTLEVATSIPQFPRLVVTNVNGPFVDEGGIGVYTPRWGKTAGYRVVGKKRNPHVREVVIRRRHVVSNSWRLTGNQVIRGRVLIGRGFGADQLKRLKVGTVVDIKTSVVGTPRLGITSNAILAKDGLRVAHDDVALHPRTAVGIDVETRTILLLVVDGRTDESRGLTMRELAELMLALGAEHALNLDGGGSSTMVARGPFLGNVRVWNTPSDGQQRHVPNGLGWVSTAPFPLEP